MQKIIVLELNEVPYKVIDTYISEHPKSNFASILKRSARFVATTPDEAQLHPKISWQTFHRGVSGETHGIVEYNQTDSIGMHKYPPFWDLLRAENVSVGVGASIGSYPVPEDTSNISFYLPDPFAVTSETVPAYVSAFQGLNTRAVAHSSRNVKAGGGKLDDALRFLTNFPRLGISANTCIQTVKQLVGERLNPARIVRRRNIQGLMTFDVIFRQLKNEQPQLTTVFVNHVAASMHRYWAAKFPDDYENNQMPQSWRDTYKDEIDVAMDHADHMLGKLRGFVEKHPEYRVLVVGSMGQHAIEHEVVRNQLVVGNFDNFAKFLGIPEGNAKRLASMEPENVVECSDTPTLEKFIDACKSFVIGEDAITIRRMNDTQACFWVDRTNLDFDHATFNGEKVLLKDTGLKIEDIQDMSGSTAQHVPQGCCFVFDGHSDLSAHGTGETEHNLNAVTSTIISALGVAPKPYMKDPVPELMGALLGMPAGSVGNVEASDNSGVADTAKEAEPEKAVEPEKVAQTV